VGDVSELQAKAEEATSAEAATNNTNGADTSQNTSAANGM